MRRFSCPVCIGDVAFDADRCGRCAASLGYVPDRRDIVAARDGGAGFAVDHDTDAWWRCLNHAWGCNWMVPGRDGNPWCASCRLTRTRPDDGRQAAIAAWVAAEATKRRLVDQLLSIGLPVEPSFPGDQRLVFDFLEMVVDGAGTTGHQRGVVTLDLREIDDAYRDHQRRLLGEPFRTVIGHLRHEVGHHYWPRLVHGSDDIDEFRWLFGDERRDYPTSLEQHYFSAPPARSDDYVTSYAMAHPAEDWAETFAHYLHVRDGLETARHHGLVACPAHEGDVVAMLDAWRRLIVGINEVTAGLGQRPAYTTRGNARLDAKVAFVHRLIERDRERSADARRWS